MLFALSVPAAKKSRGFTLVEILIVLVLGMIILLAVSLLFVNSSRSRADIQRSAQQFESGFLGMAALQEDIRMAGYLGELNPTSLTTPTVVPAICTNVMPTAADVADALPLPVQSVNDVTVATKPPCILENVVDGTDILVVRRLSSCFAEDATCADGSVASRHYLQASRCNPEPASTPAPVTHRILKGVALTVHTAGNFDLHETCPSSTPIASIAYVKARRIRTHIYYVAQNNIAGDGVPTLKRLELDGSVTANGPEASAGWSVSVIAEGVQNLQAEFGLDATGGGYAGSFYENVPGAVLASPLDTEIKRWMGVTQVKVYLLGRSLDRMSNFTDTKKYCLKSSGCATTSELLGPYSDSYKRQIVANEVRLVNPSGRKE